MKLKKRALSILLAIALAFAGVGGLTVKTVYAADVMISSFVPIKTVTNVPWLNGQNDLAVIADYLDYLYPTVTAYTTTGTTISIPVIRWDWDNYDYSSNSGSYIYKAVLDMKGISNPYNLSQVVFVNANSTGSFDSIAPISAGNSYSGNFLNAAEVIAYLNANYSYVYLNNRTSTLPVKTWVDKDNYNPLVLGSYTFTATMDSNFYANYNYGNQVASIEVIVSNITVDKTPPDIPDFTASLVNEKNIYVTITAPYDNIGVKGYIIYLNGKTAVNTNSRVYTLSNMAEGDYEISVVAYDAAGNKSIQSRAKTVSVLGDLIKSSDGTYYTYKEPKISKALLTKIYELKTKLVISKLNYKWTIASSSINLKNLTGQYDLTLINDISSSKSGVLQNAINKAKTKAKTTSFDVVKQFEFLHKGDLPFEAELTLQTDPDYSGKYLYVYYLNESKRILELVTASKADIFGDISMLLTRGSVYVVAEQLLMEPTIASARNIYLGFSELIPLQNVVGDAKATYKSSDDTIVSIDSKGFMTGYRYGTVTVTANITQGSKEYTLETKVTVKDSMFDFLKTISELEVGKSFVFRVRALGYSKDVLWETSDSDIATIDQTGKLIGVSKGTVTVSATSDGKTLTKTVIIK